MLCEPAPAAPDVEQAHAGVQSEFSADQIQLPFLGFRQIRRATEIGAGILHLGIQHRLKEFISQIVVSFADNPCPVRALEVDKNRGGDGNQGREIQQDAFIDPSPECPAAHLVQGIAIPPAIHVGLPQTQCAFRENARIESSVVNPEIPWTVSVDRDVRASQNRLKAPLPMGPPCGVSCEHHLSS